MSWLALIGFVICPVSRFKEVRIVVVLVQGVGAFVDSFDCDIVGLVKMMICGVTFELDMSRRTVVLL